MPTRLFAESSTERTRGTTRGATVQSAIGSKAKSTMDPQANSSDYNIAVQEGDITWGMLKIVLTSKVVGVAIPWNVLPPSEIVVVRELIQLIRVDQ